MNATLETPTTLRAGAGQYLGFRLADQEYGLDILSVQEINRNLDTTRIPRLQDYVRGVINLRGRIVPVIDLRRRLDLPAKEDDEATCNIVVSVRNEAGEEVVMGLVVDAVTEVHAVAEEQLSPPPEMGERIAVHFITGIARLDRGIVVLLDAARLVDLADVAAAAAASAESTEGET